jgi:hypothetical protein
MASGSGGNRFLTIGAAAGSLALLAAVVLVLWPPEPADYAFTAGRAHVDGETVGWVSKVESNTIHVNSGPFGGGVVPLVVTKTTKITVGTKEGWFEDIRPGGQVKVAYELYHGRRFARSVELLVDEGSRHLARSTPQLKGPADTPAPSKPVTSAPAPDAGPATAPTPTAAAPASAAAANPAPPPEIRPALRPAPATAQARPQPLEIVPPPRRASATTPTRSVSAPENGSRAPEPARAVETVRPPAPAASRPAEPARGADSAESTDGSAAVDWLLKGRR